MADFYEDMFNTVELMFTPNRGCSPDFAPLAEGAVVGSEQCENCGNCVYVRRGDVMVCVTDEEERDLTGYEGCGTRYRIFEEIVSR